MDYKTRKAIMSHIERIIEDYKFSNRRKNNPDECLCYQSSPCHQICPGELNCFLCYCPEYDTSKEEGGCKIKNPKGKWFFHSAHPKGKIWDCVDCDYPNREETVKNYLKNLFGLKD